MDKGWELPSEASRTASSGAHGGGDGESDGSRNRATVFLAAERTFKSDHLQAQAGGVECWRGVETSGKEIGQIRYSEKIRMSGG